MKRNNKTAISLIVLVITILVLSILAATIIISLSNTNIISQASDAIFKSDMSNYKELYETYMTNNITVNPLYNRNELNLRYEKDFSKYKEIFGNVPEKYQDGLKVVNGKLVYETEVETEKAILKELNMEAPLVTWTTAGIPIPSGFYYVGGTKDTGFVISDKSADEEKGVTYDCVGNQFVWVPVEYNIGENEQPIEYPYNYVVSENETIQKTSTLYRSFTAVFKRGWEKVESVTESGVNIYKMTRDIAEGYEEPSSLGYTNEVAEYYAMMESVQKYRGFYIARFEAGDGDATDGTNNVEQKARSGVTTAHRVVSKKNAYVYNYIPWGESMTSIVPFTKDGVENVAGAVYLSQHMYENHSSVVSTLCYGVQWDATMNFVSDEEHNITKSIKWGNFDNSEHENSGKLNLCGANEAWQAKNIYDLAGNSREWTMEARNEARVLRGGSYIFDGNFFPASDRYVWGFGGIIEQFGFRPTLYIKCE